jgi:chromosome segregation ATPase
LRIKRGWINFIGEGLHILTGIATDREVERNDEHINKLEQSQAKFLHVASEEMTIIKTTISSINSTMDKVSQNEEMLKNHMIVMEKQTRDKLSKLEAASEQISTINEQIKSLARHAREPTFIRTVRRFRPC